MQGVRWRPPGRSLHWSLSGPISVTGRERHICPMTALVRYLTHPQVQIDSGIPVPSWGLSAVGRTRVGVLIQAGWLNGTTQVVSSAEQKALETAQPIAVALNLALEVRAEMHENDRS